MSVRSTLVRCGTFGCVKQFQSPIAWTNEDNTWSKVSQTLVWNNVLLQLTITFQWRDPQCGECVAAQQIDPDHAMSQQ